MTATQVPAPPRQAGARPPSPRMNIHRRRAPTDKGAPTITHVNPSRDGPIRRAVSAVHQASDDPRSQQAVDRLVDGEL